MFCKIKFHFSPKRDWRADKTVIFFLNFKMTAGQLVERLPPSKSCTVTGMAPKRCGSVFFFYFFFLPAENDQRWLVRLTLQSGKCRPPLIGVIDSRCWLKARICFQNNCWIKSSEDYPALVVYQQFTLKWLHVMAVLRMFRWIHRLRFPYVIHRPVLPRSEHAWHLLHRPVSHCHFLFPGFWILKMIQFNVRRIHPLVSTVVSCIVDQ